MKKEKSCGAVVTRIENNEIQILMIHQVQGHWCFPKGHVENNETEEQTAIREIKEETGLDVVLDTNFRNTLTYSPKENVKKEVVYFIAHPIGGNEEVQQSELLEEMWLNIPEASAIVTFENDAEVLTKAIHYLQSHGYGSHDVD